MQPAAQTGIVWKISIFLFLLLAVVLYKMNDYFKQEKLNVAQSQLRNQIVSIKTSVSSQISTLKNVLSSHEYDLNESKINWVQLDPFFGIATAQKTGRSGNQFRINQFIGRSGSIGENWNAAFLERALSRQVISSDQPITIQLFQDNTGTKYMSLRFVSSGGRALVVVGGADYFQKYFDLSRGGKVTALLETTEHVLAAHSEADYLGTLMDETGISTKKFILEKEEIAGTNLTAMNFLSRKSLINAFAVPWSVVGLIIGFGLLIIGVLIYTLDPIDRRIEKYRMQEREQIFKETLTEALPEPLKPNVLPSMSPQATLGLDEKINVTDEPPMIQTATDLVKAKVESAAAAPMEKAAREIESEFGLAAEAEIEEASIVLDDLPTDSVGKFSINRNLGPIAEENSFPEKALPQQSAGVFTFTDESDQYFDPELTYTPAKTKTEQPGFVTNDSDGLDLEKALSLDELDTDDNVQSGIDFVQKNLTSKKINTTKGIPEITKPSFAVKRKKYQVDDMQVAVRRPDRS